MATNRPAVIRSIADGISSSAVDDRPVPHQAAIALMPAVFGLALLVAPVVGALGLVWQAEFPLVEALCILLPAVVAARLSTGSVRGALALRWPGARVLTGSLLFGATFWYLNFVLVAPIFQEHTSASDRVLGEALAEELPLLLELVVLALVPAVCEETLVRGAIARGLAARFGTLAAVLLSSAYFALLHLSLARALPTFVLGAASAGIVLRTGSLLPAVIIHFLHNAAALVITTPSMAGAIHEIAARPELALAASALGSAGGLFMLLHRR
jgi:membrane protease YdiL (CAAX protease family)